MPAVGKSTVGVLLAKRSGFAFIDSDLEIQAQFRRGIQDIIDTEGCEAFRAIEERYILSLRVSATVISTGGSVIYGERAMRHLSELGTIVLLDGALSDIEARIGDLSRRGLVRRADQTLADLYAERMPLYRRWADYTVECENKSQEQIAGEIVSLYESCQARKES